MRLYFRAELENRIDMGGRKLASVVLAQQSQVGRPRLQGGAYRAVAPAIHAMAWRTVVPVHLLPAHGSGRGGRDSYDTTL